MTNQENTIDDFFNRYAARFNWALWNEQFDIDAVVESFAEEVIAANPLGVRAGKNDQAFKEAILKGWGLYRSIGIHSMSIISKTITLLDDFHAMVKIRWQCLFVTKEKRAGEIEFDVIYMVQMRFGSIKIFAYITGDEQQELKNSGLIESSSAAGQAA